MSLRTIYERFLSSSSRDVLTETASLHYVTTLKSFSGSTQISRHLESQNKNVVKKTSEKIVSVVEGHNSLAAEIDTTIEFVSNGGSYLPGMDDFIVDRTATLPITHMVFFDSDQKIAQIRLTWDQGSLLKQVEVIGSRGKNWPVFDGKDQIKLINNNSKLASTPAPAPRTPPRGRENQADQQITRNQSPSKKYIKDPHTSLDLSQQHEAERISNPNAVAPRDSAKPPQREMSELFAAGHEDLEPSPGGSPNKKFSDKVVAPKGASSQRFAPPRLFDDDPDFKEPKIYKTNPARYNHFDIGDPDEEDAFQYRPTPEQPKKNVPMVARNNKNLSHWEFEDFNKPVKVSQKVRGQDAVHFSIGDEDRKEAAASTNDDQPAKPRKDLQSQFELQDNGTPIPRAVGQPKPRKDAETHFSMRDDQTPAPRRIIARTDAAKALYRNNVYDEEADPNQPGPAPLSKINNNTSRSKNFDSHWDEYDDLPADSGRNNENKPIGENRKKAVRTMESHWDAYNQSPEVAKKAVGTRNVRKGFENHWSLGDENGQY